MKKWLITIIAAAPVIAFIGLVTPVHLLRANADGTPLAPPIAKLPYARGQKFLVTQGYNTLPTHIKKDSYALDFTQNGCDAYGASVVAAASGKAMFLSQEGYNGGYGTELIIDHGNNIVSRYAHMIPGSITIAADGVAIRQGQIVGLLGDTGLVAGAACVAHPGTHLHFAMDTVNPDGTFSAYDPEPISGYTDMTAGKWYLSDNGNDDADVNAAAVATSTPSAPVMLGQVLGAYDVATTTVEAASTTVVVENLPSTASSPNNNIAPTGGVSVTLASPAAQGAVSAQAQASSTTTSTIDAVDSSDATTTPENASEDASSTATSSAPVAPTSSILFSQLDDSVNSPQSFYDDNWFELGNGFSGTLNTLTLKGAVSNQDYYASHVSLQEFKDKNYTALVQDFPISDNAPFTYTMATTTFDGLSILLKPYFYYRLSTVQDWQNRSVILAGTATTTTGTVMWDNFIYGTGGVEYTTPFFPFMTMEGIAATSTLTPPPLTAPTNLRESFDELGMQLNVSFSTSTDPDWSANPLHYEMNYSTSTSLSDSGWTAPAAIPVVMGNSYLIGIRAEDDYGDVSAVATSTWNFPTGFTPYLLSPGLGYAYQYFTVPSTSTLQSIGLFTANFYTSARNPDAAGCSLEIFDEYNLSSLGMTPSDNGSSGYGCAGKPTFSFASSSLTLYPSHRYHWVFSVSTGNPSTGAAVQFYGTATDTAGGLFGDPSLVNAKFTVTGDTGVLFEN